MASRKKKKSPAKKAPRTPGRKVSAKPFTTAFLKQFRARFLDRDAPRWPAAGATRAQMLSDLKDALEVLFLWPAGERPENPAPGSMKERVSTLATESGWDAEPAVPREWRRLEPTIRLFEMGGAINILLEAINRAPGAGTPGGSSDWPPTRPSGSGR